MFRPRRPLSTGHKAVLYAVDGDLRGQNVLQSVATDCFVTGHAWSWAPVHYSQHLLPDVLCPAKCSGLEEVLEAPRHRELVVLPCIIHREKGKVVPLCLVEAGFPLVSKGLLFLRQIKEFSSISTHLWSHDCHMIITWHTTQTTNSMLL